MIRTDRLTKAYGESVVVDGVSLEIPRGGVTALVGPNGAGKSTLLGMIARLLSATSGVATVDDLDVATAPSDEIARRLSILRQDNHLAVRLTVRDLVGFGRFPHSRGRLTQADLAHVQSALEQLDLVPLADRFLDELSGGQRQRAFVAMVLAQDTDYVLLDEPLNNLDMRHAADMMAQLRHAADRLGRTIVIVVHDINAASAYADHIIAMRDGRVAAQGTPAEIMQPVLLQEIFGVPIRVEDVGGCLVGLHFLPFCALPAPASALAPQAADVVAPQRASG
ncbi:MAG: ATP-binding cassette domain-containing protein [Micrococcales bacterium]|nr:ATP-binding cassette domain-containing protein [Micrococcales bacterium]